MSPIAAKAKTARPVLVVTGQIVNDGPRDLPVPQTVRVGLTDTDNRELYHWTFKPDATVLKPGAQSALPHPAFQSARGGALCRRDLRQGMTHDALCRRCCSAPRTSPQRLRPLCKELAALPERPQVAAPVLVGAFVFASDLVRGPGGEKASIWKPK